MPVTYNIVYQLYFNTKILRNIRRKHKTIAHLLLQNEKKKKEKNETTRPDWRGSEGPRKFIFWKVKLIENIWHWWIHGEEIARLVKRMWLNRWSLNSHAEKAMAPHSSTLAWKIPWTEEPSGLQSMGSLRVRHDWATSLSLFTFMHWRRKWQPTPVFMPGESQGWGSLMGCYLWGRTESDMTEVT